MAAVVACLAEPTATSTTATSTTAGEPAATTTRARVRRRERRAEARREVSDGEAGRPRAEVATGGDPVDRTRLVERLWHVELRALENALGDAECDPIDEVPLPQLERRRRRFVEAREVREVAAEGLPAFRFDLRGP